MSMRKYEVPQEQVNIIEQKIDSYECDAMRVLHAAGWNKGEIRITFGYQSESSVNKHVHDRCRHMNEYSYDELDIEQVLTVKEMNHLECSASRLLYKSGWSKKELKMILQVTRTGIVANHLSGECSHDREIVPPVL